MPTAQQIYAKAHSRAQSNGQGSSGQPFVGVVTSSNPKTEVLNVSHAYGNQAVRTIHPYVGTNHWHRIGPDTGQRVMLQVRMDSKETSALGYVGADVRDQTPARRIERYEQGKDLYRPMNIGEQEITSSGVAQAFFSRRPALEVRGGMVRGWHDQDKMEAGARAVTHVRQLHLNEFAVTGDEERFGGVTRPDTGGSGKSTVWRKIVDAPAGPTIPGASSVNVSEASDPEALLESAASTTATEPAKELLYVLKSGSGILIDHREGHVIDDEGKLIGGKFGKKLRYRKKIYGQLSASDQSGLGTAAASAGTGSDTYEEQVDEDGNLYIGLPQTATEGIKFEIPAGKFTLKSGTASAEITLDGLQGSAIFKATQDVVVRGESSAKLHAAQVKIGQTEAAVNKAIATTTYKASEQTMGTTLSGMGTADGTLNTAMSAVSSILAAVNAVVMVCPLTPGVVVGLLGMAHSIIPSAFHVANGVLKIAKGAVPQAQGAAWDGYESQSVSLSS